MQVANIFLNQEVLSKSGLSPFTAIEKYTNIRTRSVKTDFYDDCPMIPDPAELNVEEKNLLILAYCFRGKQNKEERITREDDTIIAIHFTFPCTTSNYLRKCEFYYFVFTRCKSY